MHSDAASDHGDCGALVAKAWRKRPDAPKRTITGRRWYAMRRQVYAEQKGVCALCDRILLTGEWALDHRIPLSQGGGDDMGNLQGVCNPCHARKSAEDKGHRIPRTIGEDGWPADG